MRPYRKVDMGSELESHDGRLTKLERLEAQLRVFQAIASLLFVFVLGTTWKDCQAEQQESIDQKVIANEVQRHKEQPHNVGQDVIKSLQATDLDYGERIRWCEKRLHKKR